MEIKKVLITSRSFGNVNDEPYHILQNAGYEYYKMNEKFDYDVFAKLVIDADALIIGAHEFPSELMEKCEKLKIICKHGAGLDNINLDKAKELGIIVCNAPGTNSNAVADLVIGLMLATARKIVQANFFVHEGQWKTTMGVDVYKKTLGILGFGAIGKCVARRAIGFNMNLLVYDPYIQKVPEEFQSHVELSDKDTVIKNCDFLTVHMPLNDETRNMVAAKELSSMKNGAIVINTARGGIINERDLYHAVMDKKIRAAGLDVSEKEPMDPDNPLLSCDTVIITPHIGMYSEEAIGAVGMICAQNIANFEEGKNLLHRVC